MEITKQDAVNALDTKFVKLSKFVKVWEKLKENYFI